MAVRLFRGVKQYLTGRPWLAFSGPTIQTDAARTAQKPHGFKMTVDAAGFRPNEVSVELSGRVLTVHGQCRRRTDAGFFSSSLFRRVWLPDYVQAGALTSRLTKDGYLVLEAPVDEETKSVGGGDKQKSVEAGKEAEKGATEGSQAKEAGAAGDAAEPAKQEAGSVEKSASEEQEMFRVLTDVSEFSPDEVSVKVTDGVVTVEAEHEDTTAVGATSRRLFRRFVLPEEVDSAHVTFRRTDDGHMVVEAPIGRKQAVEVGREQTAEEDVQIPVRKK